MHDGQRNWSYGERVVCKRFTGVRGVSTNTAAGWAADGNSTEFGSLRAADSIAEIGTS
jgi:hypothetical protein